MAYVVILVYGDKSYLYITDTQSEAIQVIRKCQVLTFISEKISYRVAKEY